MFPQYNWCRQRTLWCRYMSQTRRAGRSKVKWLRLSKRMCLCYTENTQLFLPKHQNSSQHCNLRRKLNLSAQPKKARHIPRNLTHPLSPRICRLRNQCNQTQRRCLPSPRICRLRNQCKQTRRCCLSSPRISLPDNQCNQTRHRCLPSPRICRLRNQCNRTRRCCLLSPRISLPDNQCNRTRHRCLSSPRICRLCSQCKPKPPSPPHICLRHMTGT